MKILQKPAIYKALLSLDEYKNITVLLFQIHN